MTHDGLRLFYVAPEAVQGEQVVLGPEESAHIRRVLKMKAGAICRVATDDGREYRVELTEIDPPMRAPPESSSACQGDPPPPPRSPWAFPCSKESGSSGSSRKPANWASMRFIRSHSRGAKPGFRRKGAPSDTGGGGGSSWKPPSSATACPRPSRIRSVTSRIFSPGRRISISKLMGYLGEGAISVKDALSRVGGDSAGAPLRAALLTGPEGDLTEEESGQALDSGFLPISLGPRILRADTAPVALVTIVQHALGDMG